ncbi:MAG: hypothetical protein ABJD11_02605 [Gemmatimonadota bacterium]
MFSSLFGPSTLVGVLRGGLDESSLAHRGIASRVANALTSSGNAGGNPEDFASHLAGKGPKQPQVDLEQEMVKLANTQLRFDTSAKLLQKAYADYRTALKSNG